MTERDLAQQTSEYLQRKYPGTQFRFDLAADLKLTMGQARRNKAINPFSGWPDMGINAARGGYHGLFIELKKDGENIYATRTDKWGGYASEHLQKQAERHKVLREAGYCVEFAVGTDQVQTLIDWYMGDCKGKLLLERGSNGQQRFTNTESGEVF